MVKLKYDSSGVDRSKADQDFTPPKPGVYPMKIESATMEEKNGGDRIVFVVRMLEADKDGNGKGYGFWDYVPVDLDWKLDNWLVAVGIDTESKPTGTIDVPKDFVGKKIMGRVKSEYFTPDGADEPQYKPKLARPLPFLEGDTGEEDEVDESEFEEEVETEEEIDPEDGGESEVTPEDLAEMGAMADEEDDDAIISLNALALQAGLDPDEYETWSALAEALLESLAPPKPAKKAAAKKAAAKKTSKPAKKAPAPPAEEEDEEDEGDGEDYESWSLEDLKAEADSRGIPSKGSKTAIIARLRTADSDPFAD